MRTLALAALLWAVFSFQAQAQPICVPYENIKKQIEQGYKERLIFRGLNSRGWMVEIWMSVGGTWTMTRTNPVGTGCWIDAGEDAVQFEWKLPGTAT